MSITGEPTPAQGTRVAITDIVTGIYATRPFLRGGTSVADGVGPAYTTWPWWIVSVRFTGNQR